jgi:hypothetical protein
MRLCMSCHSMTGGIGRAYCFRCNPKYRPLIECDFAALERRVLAELPVLVLGHLCSPTWGAIILCGAAARHMRFALEHRTGTARVISRAARGGFKCHGVHPLRDVPNECAPWSSGVEIIFRKAAGRVAMQTSGPLPWAEARCVQ